MNLEYWYLFPTAIGIATIAMASGVEGATFFYSFIPHCPKVTSRSSHRYRFNYRGFWLFQWFVCLYSQKFN